VGALKRVILFSVVLASLAKSLSLTGMERNPEQENLKLLENVIYSAHRVIRTYQQIDEDINKLEFDTKALVKRYNEFQSFPLIYDQGEYDDMVQVAEDLNLPQSRNVVYSNRCKELNGKTAANIHRIYQRSYTLLFFQKKGECIERNPDIAQLIERNPDIAQLVANLKLVPSINILSWVKHHIIFPIRILGCTEHKNIEPVMCKLANNYLNDLIKEYEGKRIKTIKSLEN